jgi:predicted nucleotide-binding protein
MRIGLIGGWRDQKLDDTSKSNGTVFELWRTREEFVSFCDTLGRRLGELNQAVIVGSDEDDTADKHVIGGLLKASPTAPSLVSVIREGGRTPFREWREQYPEIFSTIPRPAFERGAAKLIAVQEADAVITIAGFRPTLYAGIGALYSGKRVVPVPRFGGASAQLLDIVQKSTLAPPDVDYGRLDGPAGDDLARCALQIAGVGRKPRVMIIHGHGTDRVRLREWLLRQDCEPLLMVEEVNAGKTLPEKFEDIAQQADAAIALATPDDLGGTVSDDIRQPRARQNVWLEIGWFWGLRGRHRVIVLMRGAVETPSDYSGVEVFQYQTDPGEQKDTLIRFLDSIRHR